MSEEWKASTAKYLKARNEAGTKAGDEYAARLAAMPPDAAAKEIYRMFALCSDDDLAEDISCDLRLPYKAAERIAEAIIRRRRAPRLCPLVLFETDTWIVLTRTPRAFGPFANHRKAKLFAAGCGGIALTWYDPGSREGWDHKGAVWFNNDWSAPLVIGGPFLDCEDARSFCAQCYGAGIGVAIDLELPDDDFWDDDDDGEPVIVVISCNSAEVKR